RRLDLRRPTGESLLRQVDWALNCGLPVPPQQLVTVAGLANSLFSSRFAHRAAGAVPDGPYRGAAQVELARAQFHKGEYAQAEELLGGVLQHAGDLATAKSAAVLRAQLLLRNGAVDALDGLADEWATAVDRLEAAQPRLAGTPAVVLSRTGCRLLRIQAMIAGGLFASPETELLQVLDADGASPEVELVARTLLADVFGATGRLQSAAALTRRALDLLHGNEAELLGYYEIVLAPHITALIRLGEYDDVTAELERYAGSGLRGPFYFGGSVTLAAAIIEILQSRPAQGLELLAAAVEGLRQLDLENLLPLALAVAAHTAATAGLAGLAESYLAGLADAEERPLHRLRLVGEGFAAAARFRLYQVPADLDQLRALMAEAKQLGLISDELDLRLLALRLGSLDGLDDLVKVAELSEGAAASLLTSLVRALRDEDMAAFLRILDNPSSRHILQPTLQNLRTPVLAPEDAAGTTGQRDFLAQVKRQLQKSLPSGTSLDTAPNGRSASGRARAGGRTRPAGASLTGPAGASRMGTAGGEDAAGTAGITPAGGTAATASTGGTRASVEPWTHAADAGVEPPQAAPVKLTRREHEIGGLVLEGMQNADIAERLGLSVRTVEGHIYRMFAKLHISSREELELGHLG
ncbi:LuxR family transcriptional regulator, partial [Arthrobacter crystallopoietes BAB-32]